MRLPGIMLVLMAIGPAAAGDLPDPKLTPGKPDPKLTTGTLCAKGFRTNSVRNVPQALKAKVYAAENFPFHFRNLYLSKVIPVRDVPDHVHNTLRARAAGEGMTLTDF